jgi:hypothetical protein
MVSDPPSGLGFADQAWDTFPGGVDVNGAATTKALRAYRDFLTEVKASVTAYLCPVLMPRACAVVRAGHA